MPLSASLARFCRSATRPWIMVIGSIRMQARAPTISALRKSDRVMRSSLPTDCGAARAKAADPVANAARVASGGLSRHGLRSRVHPRLVLAGLGPERDRQTVPAVDGNDRERQVDQLGFAEVLAYGGIDRVGHVAFGDERQRLGPFQRGALALAVEIGFAPGIEQVKALLGLAGGARVLAVHVEAIGAAVD